METEKNGLMGGCGREESLSWSPRGGYSLPPVMITEKYDHKEPRIVFEWSPRLPDTKVEDKSCNNLRLVYTGCQYEVQFLSSEDDTKAPEWDYVSNDGEAFELLASALDHLVFLQKAKNALDAEESNNLCAGSR